MANGAGADRATAIFTDSDFMGTLGGLFSGVFGTVNTALNNKSAENIAGISGQYVPPGSVGTAGGGTTATDPGLTALLAGLLGRNDGGNTGPSAGNIALYALLGVVLLGLISLTVVLVVRGKKG